MQAGVEPIETVRAPFVLNESQYLLREKLQAAALRALAKGAAGLVYASGEEFVLKHGNWYTPQPWRRKWQIGVPLYCYGNALARDAFGWQYIEGYALGFLVGRGLTAIPHAWNVDQEGNLIDSTWANTGLAYLGVRFSAERADDATWNGDACVLKDSNRAHPLFRQPWQGEDFSLRWPFSERIAVLRSQNKRFAQEWVYRMRRAGL